MSVRLQCVCARARGRVCVRVCARGADGERGGWAGATLVMGAAENWCYQYLTNPASIFMADNGADQ